MKIKHFFIGSLTTLLIIGGLSLGYSQLQSHDSHQNIYQKLNIFTTVLNIIQQSYVDKTDPNDLINNAIRGMLSDLDPHTNYMTSDQFKSWSKTFAGYSGIGISFDIIRKKITIMSVFEGGPAFRSGLQAGDHIIEINGESAIGIKRDDVPKKLMGPAGTQVRVTIERDGWEKPKEFTLTREKIKVESIPDAAMLRPGIGYVRIARFSATTGQELEKALNKLESEGMDKLILDLRGNSGGYLQIATEVADKFIPGGKMIVYTKGRIPSSYRDYRATDEATHPLYPLIVLIDHGSASASEIVSGAIQDWDRGLIVGKTSFGKGLVQSQYPFKDGSVLLVTTAKYYTPSGRCIQRDYSHKSKDEYYKEAYVDSLIKKNSKNLPAFKTFGGRTVYGGGGIRPDIMLESKEKPPSRFIIDLVYDPNRYFYTFIEDYLHEHPEIKQMKLLDFVRDFSVSSEMLSNFKAYVLRANKKIKADKFGEANNTKDLKYLLKREIAYHIWGEKGQFQVNLMRDMVLQQSMDYFPQALKLMQKMDYYKNR